MLTLQHALPNIRCHGKSAQAQGTAACENWQGQHTPLLLQFRQAELLLLLPGQLLPMRCCRGGLACAWQMPRDLGFHSPDSCSP